MLLTPPLTPLSKPELSARPDAFRGNPQDDPVRSQRSKFSVRDKSREERKQSEATFGPKDPGLNALDFRPPKRTPGDLSWIPGNVEAAELRFQREQEEKAAKWQAKQSSPPVPLFKGHVVHLGLLLLFLQHKLV